MADPQEFTVILKVDGKSITVNGRQETNYVEGEVAHLAQQFYRAMLGLGYAPSMVLKAFQKQLEAHGVIKSGDLNLSSE